MSFSKEIIVLYHAECMDGFSAAWAAWKKFDDMAEYIPVYYGKASPEGLIGKEIYTLDFSYPEDVAGKLMSVNKRLTAIDHHAGSEKATRMTQEALFDNNHSGAFLAWQYFHPDQAPPKFLLNVEDSDLFKFLLPDTTALVAYAGIFLGDFEKWDQIVADIENDSKKKEYIDKGNLLLDYQKSIFQNLMAQKQKVRFGDQEAYMVNGPRMFRSEVGHDLAELTQGMGIYWYQEKDRIHVSLRSVPNFDVSEVARKFGGNGHKNAASFYFDADKPFPWKIVREKENE